MKGPLDLSRRRLCVSALAAAAASLLPKPLKASLEKDVRSLSFHNTHTDERLETVYCVSGRYQESGLTAIDWILRDFRTGDVIRIDPKLLDLLHLLREQVSVAGTADAGVYEIISGYRSPRSNELLRMRSGAVARHSLHLKGMAADVRLTGVPLSRLHAAALDIARGGVGYYPGDDFVHVDTGRVRRW
ncbi:MAG TPA: DUF882 domain-containing protein [Thermoanaerobaculia bacterium]|nr:DUF882 domain-containing protein [Thermoanaerobaculia bacterium]